MLNNLDTLIAFATVMLGISLLITILNQMIASLFGHRATYLKDGIKDLLQTLDPNLAPHVDKIANDVLTHKLASDSAFVHQKWAPNRWKLASAIRPDELTRLLSAVSSGQPYQANIQAILDQINPALEREATLLAHTVNTLAPAATASADQLIKQLADRATKAVGRVEAGFNATMDRVRQRFTLQMRVWTVIFSVSVALIYHLDAAKIYSQISTDPQLRASLTEASTALIKQYETVQGCQASTTGPSGNAAGGTQQPSGAPPSAGTQTQNQTGSNADSSKACDPKALAGYYTQVRDQLSSPELSLFQVPDNWLNFGGWGGFSRILATAALLSLGAPFWYNALKSMVNLRSQVAEQQQKETKS